MEKIPIFFTFLLEFDEKHKSRMQNIRLSFMIHLLQLRSVFHQRIVCGHVVNISAVHFIDLFIRHCVHLLQRAASCALFCSTPLTAMIKSVCDGIFPLRASESNAACGTRAFIAAFRRLCCHFSSFSALRAARMT